MIWSCTTDAACHPQTAPVVPSMKKVVMVAAPVHPIPQARRRRGVVDISGQPAADELRVPHPLCCGRRSCCRGASRWNSLSPDQDGPALQAPVPENHSPRSLVVRPPGGAPHRQNKAGYRARAQCARPFRRNPTAVGVEIRALHSAHAQRDADRTAPARHGVISRQPLPEKLVRRASTGRRYPHCHEWGRYRRLPAAYAGKNRRSAHAFETAHGQKNRPLCRTHLAGEGAARPGACLRRATENSP